MAKRGIACIWINVGMRTTLSLSISVRHSYSLAPAPAPARCYCILYANKHKVIRNHASICQRFHIISIHRKRLKCSVVAKFSRHRYSFCHLRNFYPKYQSHQVCVVVQCYKWTFLCCVPKIRGSKYQIACLSKDTFTERLCCFGFPLVFRYFFFSSSF